MLPPYPHDRLVEVRATAERTPGGLVDCSVGTPVDPMPEIAVRALTDSAPGATGYPASIGSVAFREAAAGWLARRFGVDVSPGAVTACVGTKELVASLPRALSLRAPGRDTVLFPAIAYPTYDMGARLAGLRAVPVPLDEHWLLDLDRLRGDDVARTLVLWVNEPGNPTGAAGGSARMHEIVAWARGARHRGRQRRVLRGVHLGRSGGSGPAGHRAGLGSRGCARGALVVEALEHGRPACRFRGRRSRAGAVPRRAPQARRAHDAGAGAGRGRSRVGRRRARRGPAPAIRAQEGDSRSRGWRPPDSTTTEDPPPSTCGSASVMAAPTDGRSPGGWPKRACSSPRVTSTAAGAAHIRLSLTVADDALDRVLGHVAGAATR